MIPLVSAKNAIEAQIQIAQKQSPSAMLVARFTTTAKLPATRPQESAKNATHNTVERDVFQKHPATNNANPTHIMTSSSSASGKLILQNVKNLMLVPTPRKNAMMHAKHQTSLSVTSRTTNALDALLARTRTACILLTTARSCKKEENANPKCYKASSG